MAGGSVAQAKRRSSSTTSDNGNLVDVNGHQLSIKSPEPTHDEIKGELARKRCLNLTLKEKGKRVLEPAINNRNLIVDAAKKTAGVDEEVISKIEKAIPVEIPKSLSGTLFSTLVMGIHNAMKPLVDKMTYPTCDIMNCYSQIDLAVKTAISNLQAEFKSKQSSCFPALNLAESSRTYLQNGYLPLDIANRTCINCSHSYIDEPNSNKQCQDIYEKALRDYQKKKKDAQDEAAKSGSTVKRVVAPKLNPAYRHCHCSQMYCLNVGSDSANSCPIKCKDPETNQPYGITANGTCACPICKCQCSLAYTYDAPHIVRTRQLLEQNSIQKQKDIEVSKSRSCLAGLIREAATASVASAMASGRKDLTTEKLNTLSMTAAAQSISHNFDPHDNVAFLNQVRKDIGRPSTTVQLPAPIVLNGKYVSEIDTRTINGTKATHRQENNRLTGEKQSARVPLQPYKDAYNFQFIGSNFNEHLTDSDTMNRAIAASKETYDAEFVGMEHALKASIDDQTITIEDDNTPARATSRSPTIIALLSPTPNVKGLSHSPAKTASSSDYLKRVQKKAYKRSQETVEEVDIEDPLSSPIKQRASPYAGKVYHRIANRKNDPSVAEYVSDFHDENPFADSQEGYEQANAFLRGIDGFPQKKASKKQRRN